MHYFHVQNSSDGQWNQVLSEYENNYSDLSHDAVRKRLLKVFDHMASNDPCGTKRVSKHLKRNLREWNHYNWTQPNHSNDKPNFFLASSKGSGLLYIDPRRLQSLSNWRHKNYELHRFIDATQSRPLTRTLN